VGPLDVLAEASRLMHGTGGYRVHVLASHPGPVAGSAGINILPDAAIADWTSPLDTIIVTGSDPTMELDQGTSVRDWVVRQAPLTRRFGAVCNGVFTLAAAHLLEGRRVTTHWNSAPEFARRYPSVSIDPDGIVVSDGPIHTCAGSTAGIDLTLRLVEEDFGKDVALQVALTTYLRRPGGLSQFKPLLPQTTGVSTPIQRAQMAVLANLCGEHSIDALAARADMSIRTFARRFRQEVGITPAEFVERARLEAARAMLEKSDATVAEVTKICGFGTEHTMRRAFKRDLGISPTEYRQRYFVRN
jgi:transcriptional regulator GlxA family with amidase domain